VLNPARPAFYALRVGGWRDYLTVLHAPYTAWHLAYVAIGASLAARLSWTRLGWSLAAFALAVGVASHCLDELRGRPLGTQIPRRVLVWLAVTALAGAVAIGVYGVTKLGGWFVIVVAAGALAVPAYALELFGGRLHTDAAFAVLWGSFPVLVGYYAQTGSVSVAAALAGAAAFALSAAQRRLSTWVRRVRRSAVMIDGTVRWSDGTDQPVNAATLVGVAEAALGLVACAVVVLAAALLAAHPAAWR
jgi:hypothetical protein